MHKSFQEVVDSLDALASLIKSQPDQNGTFREINGWNWPAVNKVDLAFLVEGLSMRIKECDPQDLSGMNEAYLKNIPKRLNSLAQDTVVFMFNGNGNQAIPAFFITMVQIDSVLSHYLRWQKIPDASMLPRSLINKLRGIEAQINSITPDSEKIIESIRKIEDATEAANGFPADLAELNKARDDVRKVSIEISTAAEKVKNEAAFVSKLKEDVVSKEVDVDRIIDRCEEAYRITTTKGLAAAFEERAKQLNYSMWIWVAILVLSLVASAAIGRWRVDILSIALSQREPQWGAIWMHIALSLISVGGPVWLAWLSTKQIGQRFRLAEDYGFKSSVAKAYEGYRKEAARIDDAFEARLFSSALTRLDEAPLRLVEETSHGSPWHELIGSKAFNNALSIMPDLKDTFIGIVKKNSEGTTGKELKKDEEQS